MQIAPDMYRILYSLTTYRNKWVLLTTSTPLFFLWTQLVIAVILFVISDSIGILPTPLTLDVNICKGVAPNVAFNVVGLRSVPSRLIFAHTLIFTPPSSFSNYTLKYVDASFYQVARGLVLPFTVCTSFIFLHTRPSLRILLSCTLVTLGFFIGVFLDGTPISVIGVLFGVASSAITATHSVVIKQTLPIVDGSALMLSWYTNLLSAVALVPIIVLVGEGGGVLALLSGGIAADTSDGSLGPVWTFIWGSAITVSTSLY